VLSKKVGRDGQFVARTVKIVRLCDQRPARRLAQGLGQIALADESKLDQQRTQQTAFFRLQTSYLLKLFGGELSGLDQAVAHGDRDRLAICRVNVHVSHQNNPFLPH
jgi:hypothetical protein